MSSILPRLHAAAGGLAFLLICGFWTASVAVELLAPAAIPAAKAAILRLIPLLVLAMAVAGASGARLAKARPGPWSERKMRRMRLAAATGVLVLIPCAVLLDRWAQAGRIDGLFYAVQLLELAAGALNANLVGANLRDGLRRRAQAAARSSAG